MLNTIKKFTFFSLMMLSSFCTLQASEKMYIDDDEFSVKGDAFHIHVGNNVWLVTNTVHRDQTGLFTYECNINRSMNGIKMEYEKKWKCPYCYNYWPIGKPCQNRDCPSRYK